MSENEIPALTDKEKLELAIRFLENINDNLSIPEDVSRLTRSQMEFELSVIRERTRLHLKWLKH